MTCFCLLIRPFSSAQTSFLIGEPRGNASTLSVTDKIYLVQVYLRKSIIPKGKFETYSFSATRAFLIF